MSSRMTWARAYLVALATLAYFVVATVLVPDWLLGLGWVASAPRVVGDLLAAGAWTLFMGIGLVGLRSAQRGGWI